MAKIIPITEHFQHFLAEMKESFWGDVYGQTTAVWKQVLEADSRRQQDRYAVREAYQRRSHRRQPYRNGYYERDFVTRFGTLRLRIARTRGKSFLPHGIEPFQRRADEVALLIREAFLRGISTRQAGRVVALLTGEVVSATTVSKLTRDLDDAVQQFHQAGLSDDYAYLFLDGVSLRVRRPAGQKQLAGLTGVTAPCKGQTQTPKTKPPAAKNAPRIDLNSELQRITGVDLTRIDGIDVMVAQTLLSEVGLDMSRWKTELHFASWLGLCLDNRISGDKLLARGTRRVVNRAATALR